MKKINFIIICKAKDFKKKIRKFNIDDMIKENLNHIPIIDERGDYY